MTAAATSAVDVDSSPGRNRPMRLQWMASIGIAVRHIVQQVDDAGQRAEDDEGRDDAYSDRMRDRTAAGRTAARRR